MIVMRRITYSKKYLIGTIFDFLVRSVTFNKYVLQIYKVHMWCLLIKVSLTEVVFFFIKNFLIEVVKLQSTHVVVIFIYKNIYNWGSFHLGEIFGNHFEIRTENTRFVIVHVPLQNQFSYAKFCQPWTQIFLWMFHQHLCFLVSHLLLRILIFHPCTIG